MYQYENEETEWKSYSFSTLSLQKQNVRRTMDNGSMLALGTFRYEPYYQQFFETM